MIAGEINKVACIGSGVIGASWATNFIFKGYPVNLYDINEQQIESAKANIDGNLNFLLEKGILTKETAAAASALVSYTTDLAEAVKDVQFIQESGPESYEIKQAILADIDKYAAPEAIFASSTSGLLITEIAKYSKHPERCIGAHPYNPPHLIPLIEITKGEKTSEDVVKTGYEFYKLLGKEPVVLQKEARGFIANRLQVALYREATELVRNGVCSVEDVDKAACFGPGLRYGIMGPNLIFQLGSGAHGLKAMVQHPAINFWLADMANWKQMPDDWGDIAQAGIEEEMKNRPAEIGNTNEEIIKYRDDMLIGLLKLHKKI